MATLYRSKNDLTRKMQIYREEKQFASIHKLLKAAASVFFLQILSTGVYPPRSYSSFGRGTLLAVLQMLIHFGSIGWLISVATREIKTAFSDDPNLQILNAGREGEQALLKWIKSLPDDYHVFTNLTISGPDVTSEFDCIIVNTSGLYVIECKNYKGTLRGDHSDYLLQKIKGKNVQQIRNPVKQISRQVYTLSTFLKEHNVGHWITPCVLYTNPDLALEITDRAQIEPNIFTNFDQLNVFIRNGDRPMPEGKRNAIICVLSNVDRSV